MSEAEILLFLDASVRLGVPLALASIVPEIVFSMSESFSST